MLLASSHQMPIHGEVILSCNCEAARLKQSDITLIKLSGVLEKYRGLESDSRPRSRRRLWRTSVLEEVVSVAETCRRRSDGTYGTNGTYVPAAYR